MVFKIKRAVQVPERLQFLGHAILESKVLVQTFDRAIPGGIGPLPSSQAATLL